MNFFRFVTLFSSALIIHSCRMCNGNDVNVSHTYDHAVIIYEDFCVLRNYSESEYDMLERKGWYASNGQILEVTADSTLSYFSDKIDSVIENAPSDGEKWGKNIYIVAIFEGENVNDTIAVNRFENQGVYINGRYYEDSSLFMSLLTLLGSRVQRY